MTAIAARVSGIRWTSPRTVGILGILLGVVAFWIALPPIHSRTVLVPALIGIVAVFAGIWAQSRGERRLGWLAVAFGVLGVFFGFLATQSTVTQLDQVVVWSALIAATFRYSTPLIFAAIGGLYCERSGVVNVALEGMLLTGAFFGILGVDMTHKWYLGVLIAMLAGMAMATIHAVWSIHLQVDQIIAGTALNFLAVGITGFIFIAHYGDTGTPGNITQYSIPDVHLTFLQDVTFLGPIFAQLNLMIWLGFALVAATWVIVFRTPFGLRLRSVGEHPRAADTVGISVYKMRYIAVIASGAIAACGGAYLSIGFVHSFNEQMTAGAGFIGLAALVTGKWKPFSTWAATLLFGFASAVADRLPNAYGNEWGTLFQTLPYVLTLVAVAGVIGRSIGPAAAGRPYVKQ